MIAIPKGYRFSTAQAGFKYTNRDDLALLFSDVEAAGAAVFTTNRFQAAPVIVAKELLSEGAGLRGILVNAGQANACTGAQGIADCRRTLQMTAEALGVEPGSLLPASTGVIGDHLKMELWERAVPALIQNLGQKTPMDAAKAIMTTDSFPKMVWRTVQTVDGEITILGMAKGAGMICPNMATMLGFVLCDADVDPSWWQETIAQAVDKSFNAVTVDGDTSTNDCVIGLANSASRVNATGESRESLRHGLVAVCRELSYRIVQDAEGGTKVVTIRVTGGVDDRDAERAARTIGHSPLVKTAMFGQDPNWGRIVAALGRSGAAFDPDRVQIRLANILIFSHGRPVAMDRDAVFAVYLSRKDIEIHVDLREGTGHYTLLTSDLTHEYVRINAEYRT
ncbi:MAG: bifunctional glutamate N-acetyltransferase/amino-acid acetyltransferase ArgJ [Desulfovibrionales bacterium]